MLIAAASWWEETARAVGLTGGALVTTAIVFRTVPPFRQVSFYFWRRLVTDPLHESFKRAVSEVNAETIRSEVSRAADQAIGRAVPSALRQALDDDVMPKLKAFGIALDAHMRAEEGQRAKEQQFRDDVLSKLAEAEATNERIDERVRALEETIRTGTFGGTIVFTPSPSLDGDGHGARERA